MANNIKYITEYQKANMKLINVRLSKKYDADIIEWLDLLGEDLGKATYIKQLIRDDINNIRGRL
jgi:hypothetical protein